MTKSHSVDILNSGFVIKTAKTSEFNEKLHCEIEKIKVLCQIYPNLIVPILHDGSAEGRRFYILEKKHGSSLSKIVFDNDYPIKRRRKIICQALDQIKSAIEIECSKKNDVFDNINLRLLEEWDKLSSIHELFDTPIMFEGRKAFITGRSIVEKALHFSKTERFISIENAHCNFHFGNVIFNEIKNAISFIDPDCTMNGVDPYFGYSRFVFSFWHELANEIQDAVKIIPVENNMLFTIQNDDHRNIVQSITELQYISGISRWIDKSDYKRFYTLTVLCFLRSIRINGDLKEWKAPQHPRTATPSEILFLGLHYYLESLPANIYQ